MIRIKELRKEEGKTQKEVAEKLGVTSQCLGYYERLCHNKWLIFDEK